ncbi:MAG: metallophosphoesterase [Kofleriaceae bacterium]
MRSVVLMLALAACRGHSSIPPAADAAPEPDTDFIFGVVGDTRPPSPDDTYGYPTAIITQIWQDIEAEPQRVPFVVSTGDYMFAYQPHEVTAQLGLYMQARSNYTGIQYPVMGNHECTGATASNCGSDGADGITANYTGFLTTLLAPIDQTLPYYTENFTAPDSSWTAKFVFIACNAWDDTQATWLQGELAKPATYTFVLRHEGTNAVGETPCGASGAIIDANPLTLLIVGHTHTYTHKPLTKELVLGIGGAPLTSGKDYGYAIITRQPDGNLKVRVFTYNGRRLIDTFLITPSGDAA